jgi:DNA-binding MarR family transcriptional regulator
MPLRPPSGTDNFGNLFRDPALAMQELVVHLLREHGSDDIRLSHALVAQHIADEGSRITDLAERVQLTKPTVVHVINELEALGYVERRPDPTDGRAKLVVPTPRLQNAVAVGREAIAAIERAWAAALGERETAELRRLLLRLRAVLWPERARP